MYKLIVLFFLGFMLYSCQKKPQVVLLKKQDKSLLREPEYLKKIRLELQDLKSNEIQEKLTLEDEILLIATIS
ncbi:MAG: hypothetical protein RJA76_1568, partial [Bacteroidota bacterium]